MEIFSVCVFAGNVDVVIVENISCTFQKISRPFPPYGYVDFLGFDNTVVGALTV